MRVRSSHMGYTRSRGASTSASALFSSHRDARSRAPLPLLHPPASRSPAHAPRRACRQAGAAGQHAGHVIHVACMGSHHRTSAAQGAPAPWRCTESRQRRALHAWAWTSPRDVHPWSVCGGACMVQEQVTHWERQAAHRNAWCAGTMQLHKLLAGGRCGSAPWDMQSLPHCYSGPSSSVHLPAVHFMRIFSIANHTV